MRTKISRIVEFKNTKEWDAIVKSFSDYDVYYLNGYSKSFQTQGYGNPFLYFYENNDLRAITVMFKKDIAEFAPFKRKIETNKYFDVFSPYGYGGFIFEGDVTTQNIKVCYEYYLEELKKENIISAFVRYHPLLNNANNLREVSTIIDLGKTINIDLKSLDVVWDNIHSKNRNMIRKAKKNGVEIKHSKDLSLFDEFIKIYNATMDGNNANSEYYFDNEFYSSIHNDLYDNYEIFYAVYEDKIISMSVILFANNKVHYHLSGSIFEYRKLAATNLLLYEAACWAIDKGYKTFHLGGGLGAAEDSLYKFKIAFNKKSDNQFSIGKDIVDKEKYKKLVALRKELDKDFNEDSNFFPLYRA